MLFTGGLFISTSLLWFETREAGKISKTALVEGRRARIVAGGISHELRPDPADPNMRRYRFTFSWVNTGETPTKNMIAYINYYASNEPMPDDFNFTFNPGEGRPFVVGPKMPGMHLPIPSDGFSAQDMMENFNGTKFMYIWGWARYNDVFEGTSLHITKFCFQIVCNGTPMNPGADGRRVDFIYPAFQKHNCADEECGRM